MKTADMARARLGVGQITQSVIEQFNREKRQRPQSAEWWDNQRREAEYISRRNGIKQPLLQVWK